MSKSPRRESAVNLFNDEMRDYMRSMMLKNINPTPDREVKKSFLSNLIPHNWLEKVYEYHDKYIIETFVYFRISNSLQVNIMETITQEFGDNILLIFAENTQDISKIKLQLKKDNYEDDEEEMPIKIVHI